MPQVKVSLSIMAHPSRSKHAWKLVNLLDNKFHNVLIAWDRNNDEWDTGVRALRYHAKDSDWHVVLQDDAIVNKHLYENVISAIESVPSRSLISMYTGTVRPFSWMVKPAVEKANQEYASWLRGKTLFWGVGIIIPTEQIEPMLNFVKNSHNFKYDKRIGFYYQWNNKPVYYTNPSLVDHDYSIGSLIGNDHAAEPRKAYWYQPKRVHAWNSKVVSIA